MNDRGKQGGGGLVYSSGQGRMCPHCEKAVDACTCPPGKRIREGGADPRRPGGGPGRAGGRRPGTGAGSGPGRGAGSGPGRSKKGSSRSAGAPTVRDGVVRVSRSTSGRKGKGVTLITGLPPAEVMKLARELKKRCGSGGTVKDGVIEIQGEHRDVIVEDLDARGYTVKRAGG